MRKLISLVLLLVVAVGIGMSLSGGPFGAEGERDGPHFRRDQVNFGRYYVHEGVQETGAVNIVSSVVVGYRGLDTLGEVTVLFIAATGLGMVLHLRAAGRVEDGREPASLVLFTGCRFLFPLILLFGTYVFVHGHLTPGGGFQGGAVIASAFLLVYLGCRERRLNERALGVTESVSGVVFVVVGLIGLAFCGAFLLDFLPRGTAYLLFSAGIIPVLYLAIGFKVGSELGAIIDKLAERAK
ncbi:MAG: cation:proton antiporter [Planctomycetes bacterium SM23_65]|nr:MAG: cation:proton antiporter [Planctomycetes bacterium SM23_65]